MDIIQIDKSLFLKNKFINKEDEYYKNMINKYDLIFKNHKCFSSKNVFNEEYNKNYAKKNNNDNKWIIKKNIDKSITNVLNVLNKSNYDKMLEKIKIIKTEANLNIIIKEILSNCSKQSFYLKIYIDFIEDILKFSIQNDKNNIILIINDYIDKSIDIINIYLNNSLKSIVNSEENYDEFCESQKEKNEIISKNIIIINLQKKFKLKNNLNNYYNILKKTLNKQIDEEKIILIVKLLIDIKQHDKSINIDIGTINNKNKNKRLDFFIEELNKIS